MLNIYSMVFFLFHVQKPQFDYPLMLYSLMIWNLLSMVSQSSTTMMWATITLIYPFYFSDHLLSLKQELTSDQFTRSAVLLPLTPMKYFYVVFLATLHLGVTLMSMQENQENSALHRYIQKEISRNEINNAKYRSVIFKIYDLIRLRLNKIYRYIPILIALFTALHSISILNAFLLLFSLFFLWNRRSDTTYWPWFNGYVILILVVKQICNYNLNLTEYNIEFLAMCGVISIEEDRNSEGIRSLMVFNFILVYFCAGWYKKLNKKITQQTLIQDAEDEKKIKAITRLPIIKNLLKIYNVAAMIFQYYSIWIYHMGANIILLTDTRDFLNIILLITESLIAFVHISTWNRRGVHPYKKIYKVWIISFYIVVFYVMARYLLYFLKYSTIKNMVRHWLLNSQLDLDRHLFRSINGIDRENMNDSMTFWTSFARPMLLLVLAVLTRETFLRMLRGDASYQPGLLKETKNDLGQNAYEESAFNNELNKETGSISRRTNPFVASYLIFKGLFLGIVMSYLHTNMNVLKLVMIICYLLNMHVLFRDLIKLCERMQLMELFSLRAQYFYSTFLTGKKWRKFEKERINQVKYTTDHQKNDLLQNKFYYEQILVGMEQILFNVNRIFWGLVFFPLLILSTCLMLLNYIVRDEQLATQYKLDFFLGISGSKWLNESEITKELFGIQIVISFLFLEYMLTSCYLDCKATLVEAMPATLDGLLKALRDKYRYLLDSRNDSKNERDKSNTTKEEFEQALNFLPEEAVEKENKKIRDMKKTEVQVEGQPDNEEVAASIESEDDEAHSITDNSNSDHADSDSEDENSQTQEYESRNRKSTIEGAEFINRLLQKQSKTQTQKNSIFFMTELVTKEEMLLFLNKNKYKYYLIKSLESIFYIVTRIGLFPLVFPISKQLNLVNIWFLGLIIYHNNIAKQSFLEDVKHKGIYIYFYFLLQSIHEFLHTQLLMLSWYQAFMDKSDFEYTVLFLKPVDGKYYSICFYWLLNVSLGFAIIPLFVWASTKFLFRQKLSRRGLFHFYLFDSNRKRNIVIDYHRWRKSSLKFLNLIYKTAYTNALAVHSILVIVSLVALWKDMFIVVFLFTLGLSTYEHFKPDQAEQDILSTGRQQYMVILTKTYSYLYWVMFGMYHVIYMLGYLGFFKGFSKNRDLFMLKYDFCSTILILMVIRGVFQDMVLSDEYQQNHERLSSESNLKIRFANMCRAYDINENKIYYRVVEIMRKKYIDEVSNKILDVGDLRNLKFNVNYSDKCIIELINKSADELKAKYLGFFKTLWLSSLEYIYTVIIHRSNNYRYLDMMFLYQIVRSRNKELIKDEEINLEDYFDQDFKMFKKGYTDLNIFYSGLAESDIEKNELYLQKLDKLLSKKYDVKSGIHKDLEEYNVAPAQPSMSKLPELLIPRLNLASSFNEKFVESTELTSSLNKPLHYLKASVEIIDKAVQHRLNDDSRFSMESYKLEFSRCGSIKCNFGRMPVLMYNTKHDYMTMTKGFNQFKWNVFSHYASRLISSNSEYIVSLILIGIHIWAGGFTNILLIGIIIFTIFIEETLGRSFWWRILYVCYLTMTLIKQVYDSSAFLKENEHIVRWALGKLNKDAMIPDTLCILLVLYMIEFLKKYGVDNKSAIDFENPGQAINRLTVNEDFNSMLERKTSEEIRKKELLNMYLSSTLKFNTDVININDFKMVMIKLLIRNYTHLREFTTEFMHSTQKLIRAVRYDMNKVAPGDLNSFWFRNFSHYLRKPGVDYSGVASAILITLIVYVLMFFPTMGSENNKIASFIFENKVTAFTVINFAIYLTFFILHYYLDQMKSNDVKGMTSKEYTLTLIENYDAQKKSSVGESRSRLFQTVATKIKTALLLGRFWRKGSDNSNDFQKNPMFYLFMFSLFLWVYANISVFFWHPMNMNFSSADKKGMYKFVCEEKDKAGDLIELGKIPCKNYSENYLSMIFYLLNVAYLITCMLQIKGGKLLQITKITNFDKIGNLIQYKVYGSLPLVRETRMTFEYCATKTSLWFSDFTLLKELEFVLNDAKIQHKSEMTKRTGKQLSRPIQNIICFAVILVVVLLFVVPLFLFYNRNIIEFYDIKSATVKVELIAGKDQHIMNLFKVENLNINEKLIDVDPEKAKMLTESSKDFKRYSLNQYTVS